MPVLDADDQPAAISMVAAMLTRRWGDLASVRREALVEIDSAAERARGAFITRGAGQAMEYLATEAEARAHDAGSPGPFPFLEAERDAQGGQVTLAQVAAVVIAQAAAWAHAGAAIKRARRGAKVGVDVAETVEDVATVLAALQWPAPGEMP